MIDRITYSKMKPYSTFKYWFTVNPGTNTINVFDKSTKTIIGSDIGDYTSEYTEFTHRPEFGLYDPIDVGCKSNEELIDLYETLLLASTMVIAEAGGVNPDKAINPVFNCLDWLRTTDFYVCPSTTKYHDNCYGGLLRHTLKVASQCLKLYNSESFKDKVDMAKAIRASLLHEWGKIGSYEFYTKNVKDSNSGEWDKVDAYRYKENRMICLGEGTSSIYLAGKFFKLSYEEALAIRWYKGEYDVSGSALYELNQACRMYPIVYLLQFADRLACVEYA